MHRFPLFCLVFSLFVALSSSGVALAQAPEAPEEVNDEVQELGAFDKDLGIGVYGVGWAGEYEAVGVGGRLRWEVSSWLGFDAFADHAYVDSPFGFRHDHQVGFNAYFPFELADTFRLRLLIGFCATFSFVEPEDENAPRADDILYGTHGGAGFEWAFSSAFSFFVDAQAYMYLAHDREVGEWSGGVSEDLHAEFSAQLSTGVQFHFTL